MSDCVFNSFIFSIGKGEMNHKRINARIEKWRTMIK